MAADGKCRYVTRDSEGEDGDLFWAVCGGSPGAFGVTMDLVFHPIIDDEFKHSAAFKGGVLYNEATMKGMLSILQDYVNRCQDGDEKAVSPKIDLMMTLDTKNDNASPIIKPSVIVFEMVCMDRDDPQAAKDFDEFLGRFKKLRGWFPHWDGKWDGIHHLPMSKISLGFTRQAPAVTKEGRENVRPYNKTTYGSNSPLKNGFVEAYGNLLDRLAHDKHDVHCVFQVGVGGGAQRRNGVAGKSAISHRNARTMIVFDLFRPETKESIAAAVEYQRCFEFDVVEKYMTAPINGVPQPKVMAHVARALSVV